MANHITDYEAIVDALVDPEDVDDYRDYIGITVNPDSAVEVASQRVTNIFGDSMPPGFINTATALWLDGFMTGATYQRRRTIRSV